MPQIKRRVEPIPSPLPSGIPPGVDELPIQNRMEFAAPPDPRIERIKQLMTQAQGMEQQAAPHQVQPQGVKQNIVAGLSSIGQPGGYSGMMDRHQAQERQRQQDLYERANALRQRGLQEEGLQQQGEQTGELRKQTAQNYASEAAARSETARHNHQLETQAGQPKAGSSAAGTYWETGPNAGQIITPGKPATEKSLQPKEVQFKNGKHGTANFNSTTGKYHDPVSEADITDQVIGAYEKPSPDQNVVVRTVNEKGEPVERIVPKVPGGEFKAAPTAQESNRRDQARIVNNYADHLIALIDKNPNAVGPLLGRVARGEVAIGNVPPEVKALHTALGSFEALQPILHGFRGGSQTVDHFHGVIGDQHLNAAALKASINEIKALAGDIQSGGGEAGGGSSAVDALLKKHGAK